MAFLHHNRVGFVIGAVAVICLAIILYRVGRSNSKRSSPAKPLPMGSQVQVAQAMLVRAIVAAELSQGEWLKWQGGTRFRVWECEGGIYRIERTEHETWPPTPGTTMQIVCIVVQPGKDYAMRFMVDVKVPERGAIPVSVKIKDNKFAVNGALSAQSLAEASEIITWMQALDEVRPDK